MAVLFWRSDMKNERELFEDWCCKCDIDTSRYNLIGNQRYKDSIVEAYWEGWKAAKRNITPMNIVAHDCKDIYMNDFDDLVLRNIELQKRIDTLSKKVNEMAHIFLDDLEEILKGESE